ncbi:hypothetical protein KC330_g189 [Hortaea werneckii]|nr:hypothetical protein KC330_g189 [Hortaea werneckii]
MKILAQPEQDLLYFPERTSSITLLFGVQSQAFPGEIEFPKTAIEAEKRASLSCSSRRWVSVCKRDMQVVEAGPDQPREYSRFRRALPVLCIIWHRSFFRLRALEHGYVAILNGTSVGHEGLIVFSYFGKSWLSMLMRKSSISSGSCLARTSISAGRNPAAFF